MKIRNDSTGGKASVSGDNVTRGRRFSGKSCERYERRDVDESFEILASLDRCCRCCRHRMCIPPNNKFSSPTVQRKFPSGRKVLANSKVSRRNALVGRCLRYTEGARFSLSLTLSPMRCCHQVSATISFFVT